MSPNKRENLPKVVPTLAEQAMLSKEGTQPIPRIEIESSGSARSAGSTGSATSAGQTGVSESTGSAESAALLSEKARAEKRAEMRATVPEVVHAPAVIKIVPVTHAEDGNAPSVQSTSAAGATRSTRSARSTSDINRAAASVANRAADFVVIRTARPAEDQPENPSAPADEQEKRVESDRANAHRTAAPGDARSASAAAANVGANAAAGANAAVGANVVAPADAAAVTSSEATAVPESASAVASAPAAPSAASSAAEEAANRNRSRAARRSPSSERRSFVLRVVALVAVVLIALCVVIGGILAWFEWGRGDDAIDIQGEWLAVDSAAAQELIAQSAAKDASADESTDELAANAAASAQANEQANTQPTTSLDAEDGDAEGAAEDGAATEDTDEDADALAEDEYEDTDEAFNEYGEFDEGYDSDESDSDEGYDSDDESESDEGEDAVGIVIDSDHITLSKDATFSYEIDTFTKTITFHFAEKSGSARYRFSADRTELAILEGSSAQGDFLAGVRADFGWFLRSFSAWLTTGEALAPSAESAWAQEGDTDTAGYAHSKVEFDAVDLIKREGTSASTVNQGAEATPTPVIVIER